MERGRSYLGAGRRWPGIAPGVSAALRVILAAILCLGMCLPSGAFAATATGSVLGEDASGNTVVGSDAVWTDEVTSGKTEATTSVGVFQTSTKIDWITPDICGSIDDVIGRLAASTAPDGTKGLVARIVGGTADTRYQWYVQKGSGPFEAYGAAQSLPADASDPYYAAFTGGIDSYINANRSAIQSAIDSSALGAVDYTFQVQLVGDSGEDARRSMTMTFSDIFTDRDGTIEPGQDGFVQKDHDDLHWKDPVTGDEIAVSGRIDKDARLVVEPVLRFDDPAVWDAFAGKSGNDPLERVYRIYLVNADGTTSGALFLPDIKVCMRYAKGSRAASGSAEMSAWETMYEWPDGVKFTETPGTGSLSDKQLLHDPSNGYAYFQTDKLGYFAFYGDWSSTPGAVHSVTVNVKGPGGSIAGQGATKSYQVKSGGSLVLQAQVQQGYKLVATSRNAGSAPVDCSANAVLIGPISGNGTIDVTFQRIDRDPSIQHTVNARVEDASAGHGTVQIGSGAAGQSVSSQVVHGDAVEVQFHPAQGYKPSSVTVNGKQVFIDGCSLLLPAVDQDMDVVVAFVPGTVTTDSWTVLLKVGKGGTVSGATQIPVGTNGTFTIKPDAGYLLHMAAIDGQAVRTDIDKNADGTWTVKVPYDAALSSRTLAVGFIKDDGTGGGEYDPSKPVDPYDPTDPTDPGNPDNPDYPGPSGKQWEVLLNVGPKGSVVGATLLPTGKDGVFIVTPATGFLLHMVAIDGETVASNLVDKRADGTWKITVPYEKGKDARTLAVGFIKDDGTGGGEYDPSKPVDPYDPNNPSEPDNPNNPSDPDKAFWWVDVRSGPGGTVLGETRVAIGSDGSFTIQPDAGYLLHMAAIDGRAVTSGIDKNDDGTWTVKVPYQAGTALRTLAVGFIKDDGTGNGEYDPSKPVDPYDPTSPTDPDNPTKPDGKTWAVKLNVGPGGSVVGATSLPIGKNGSFTIAPDAGFLLHMVAIDGEAVRSGIVQNADGSWTVTVPYDADRLERELAVGFIKDDGTGGGEYDPSKPVDPYDPNDPTDPSNPNNPDNPDAAFWWVVVKAGPNGTVSGPTAIALGSDATFTIVPDKGYLLHMVGLDGATVPSSTIKKNSDGTWTLSVAYQKGKPTRTLAVGFIKDDGTGNGEYDPSNPPKPYDPTDPNDPDNPNNPNGKTWVVKLNVGPGGAVKGDTSLPIATNGIFSIEPSSGYLLHMAAIDGVAVRTGITKNDDGTWTVTVPYDAGRLERVLAVGFVKDDGHGSGEYDPNDPPPVYDPNDTTDPNNPNSPNYVGNLGKRFSIDVEIVGNGYVYAVVQNSDGAIIAVEDMAGKATLQQAEALDAYERSGGLLRASGDVRDAMASASTATLSESRRLVVSPQSSVRLVLLPRYGNHIARVAVNSRDVGVGDTHVLAHTSDADANQALRVEFGEGFVSDDMPLTNVKRPSSLGTALSQTGDPLTIVLASLSVLALISAAVVIVVSRRRQAAVRAATFEATLDGAATGSSQVDIKAYGFREKR